MYINDETYKTLISSNDRTGRVSGTIKSKVGRVINVTDDIIVTDTLSIKNQCLNNTSFNLGTTYAAELTMTLVTQIDRYELYNGRVALFYDIGDYHIPLGVYTITEAVRVNNKVSIKAYDDMLLFDESVTDDTTGRPYELLSHICDKCGVEMAQTETQIEALPNGTELYAVLSERVQTYRDALSYIAAVLCCFAMIDRNGKLLLRGYGAEAVKEISNADRLKDAEYSDYKVTFCGVYGRFVASQNFYTYKHIDNAKSGLLLDLGDVPIVQGNEAFKHRIIDTIWEAVKDIEYTPCSIQIKPDPALDLGDMVSSTSIANDATASCVSYMQSYVWQYRRAMVFKSMGDNPRLATIKNKQSRQLANLEASSNINVTTIKTYTNAAAFEVSATGEEIIKINYAAQEDCRPIFLATVPFTIDRDGNAVFTYKLDGAEIPHRQVTQYCEPGKHFATLFAVFDDKASTRHTLTVTLRAEYVASEKRSADAQRQTLINFADAVNKMLTGGELKAVTYDEAEPDTTPPTITVTENEIIAALYAQGIAGEGKWDGTLNITDTIGKIAIDTDIEKVVVNVVTDKVTAGVQIPTKSDLHDTFNKIDIVDVPYIVVTGMDLASYLTDRAGVILTDKDGNKLSGRGKNGK